MAKKIEEFMLDESLRDKINGTSNLTKIKLDQLDESLQKTLTNIGNASKGVVAYDDSELRNRVVYLEKNTATKTGWFNKSADKITRQMLDNEIANIISDVNDFSLMLSMKVDKSNADSTYRKTEDKISASDLTEELQAQLRSLTNRVNGLSTTLSGLNFVSTDIERLKDVLSDLPNTALTETTADTKYRRLSNPITTNDLSDNLKPAIASLQTHYNNFNNYALRTQLSNYREKTVPIKSNDLDATLQAKIQLIDNFNTNIDNLISNKVTSSLNNNFEKSISGTFIGKYDILTDQEYQDKISAQIENVNTNNKATITQSLFALYKALSKAEDTITFLKEQQVRLDSQIISQNNSNSYISNLSDMNAVDLLNTLKYINGYDDNYVDYEGVETLSVPGSTTIIQANIIGADFTEEAVKFADTYISIAKNAIVGSEEIGHIEFPSVKTVEAGAIKDCLNLKSVFLPSVTTIKDGAFTGCDKLTTIILPEAYTLTYKEGLPKMCRIIRVVGA